MTTSTAPTQVGIMSSLARMGITALLRPGRLDSRCSQQQDNWVQTPCSYGCSCHVHEKMGSQAPAVRGTLACRWPHLPLWMPLCSPAESGICGGPMCTQGTGTIRSCGNVWLKSKLTQRLESRSLPVEFCSAHSHRLNLSISTVFLAPARPWPLL